MVDAKFNCIACLIANQRQPSANPLKPNVINLMYEMLDFIAIGYFCSQGFAKCVFKLAIPGLFFLVFVFSTVNMFIINVYR